MQQLKIVPSDPSSLGFRAIIPPKRGSMPTSAKPCPGHSSGTSKAGGTATLQNINGKPAKNLSFQLCENPMVSPLKINYTSVDPKQFTVSKFRLKPVILISECFCSRCGHTNQHPPPTWRETTGDIGRQRETTSEPKKPTTPTNTKAARSKVALRTPTVNCLGKKPWILRSSAIIGDATHGRSEDVGSLLARAQCCQTPRPSGRYHWHHCVCGMRQCRTRTWRSVQQRRQGLQAGCLSCDPPLANGRIWKETILPECKFTDYPKSMQ